MLVFFITLIVTFETEENGRLSSTYLSVGESYDENLWFVNSPKIALKQRIGVFEPSDYTRVITKRFLNPIKMENEFIWQFHLKTFIEKRCKEYNIKVYSLSEQRDKMSNQYEVLQMKFGPRICSKSNKFNVEVYKDDIRINTTTIHKLSVDFKTNNMQFYKIFTVIFRRNQTYEILLNNEIISKGSFENFDTPIVEPEFVKDVYDLKPEDWDSRKYIEDPKARKPKSWNENEPEFIPDPNAFFAPFGWVESIEPTIALENGTVIPNPACEELVGCGKWTAPLIHNPNYRGKWSPPKILNPKYDGKWSQRLIKNEKYIAEKFVPGPITENTIEILNGDLGTFIEKTLFSSNEKEVKKWNSKFIKMFDIK